MPHDDRRIPGVPVEGVGGEKIAGDVHLILVPEGDLPHGHPAAGVEVGRAVGHVLSHGERQGPRLRRMASVDTHSHQIARAIDWLKDNFDNPIRVEDLASKAGLSSSAFHNHFRAMTAMSPLQFQKRMRLNEARRLMFTERLDASAAAFEVGYESPSQFSREYSRLFGAPPVRDMKNLSQVSAG
ncbi:MAG: helix-turn-helix transcriptional regulator [Rhodospirillales bacterium]|nr:helix-turn-helix transcriptional regulator [Rhodospirillales bacterium]